MVLRRSHRQRTNVSTRVKQTSDYLCCLCAAGSAPDTTHPLHDPTRTSVFGGSGTRCSSRSLPVRLRHAFGTGRSGATGSPARTRGGPSAAAATPTHGRRTSTGSRQRGGGTTPTTGCRNSRPATCRTRRPCGRIRRGELGQHEHPERFAEARPGRASLGATLTRRSAAAGPATAAWRRGRARPARRTARRRRATGPRPRTPQRPDRRPAG